MGNKANWLKESRERLNLKQDDIAARLQLAGFDFTRGTISHWENGRHELPMHDAAFRQALADALRLDERTMLRLAGYQVQEVRRSEAADRVAHLIDQLPPDKQELAVRLVEQLVKD